MLAQQILFSAANLDNPQELGLTLALESQEALTEIDSLISGGDHIPGLELDEFPLALTAGKILSGLRGFRAASYQTLDASFLEHPAVVPASAKATCLPAANASIPVSALESFEKLAKLVF